MYTKFRLNPRAGWMPQRIQQARISGLAQIFGAVAGGLHPVDTAQHRALDAAALDCERAAGWKGHV
jgi:hypothetical protein